MDAQAVEGTGVFNASSVDVTLVDSLKELQRLEVVVRLGGADGLGTTAIPAAPVVRLLVEYPVWIARSDTGR